MAVLSKTHDLANHQALLGGTTDTAGFFQINGIKFNDTLTIQTPERALKYYNKGSRYIAIYLPVAKTVDVNEKDSIVISSVRKHPKVIPVFNITQEDFCVLYTQVNKHPDVAGGLSKYIQEIKRSVIYPLTAIDHNIEGLVKLRFTINKDGLPTNFKILQGIGYGCEDEVIRALKSGPKWKPAIQKGRYVSGDVTIAIQFKLTDK